MYSSKESTSGSAHHSAEGYADDQVFGEQRLLLANRSKNIIRNSIFSCMYNLTENSGQFLPDPPSYETAMQNIPPMTSRLPTDNSSNSLNPLRTSTPIPLLNENDTLVSNYNTMTLCDTTTSGLYNDPNASYFRQGQGVRDLSTSRHDGESSDSSFIEARIQPSSPEELSNAVDHFSHTNFVSDEDDHNFQYLFGDNVQYSQGTASSSYMNETHEIRQNRRNNQKSEEDDYLADFINGLPVYNSESESQTLWIQNHKNRSSNTNHVQHSQNRRLGRCCACNRHNPDLGAGPSSNFSFKEKLNKPVTGLNVVQRCPAYFSSECEAINKLLDRVRWIPSHRHLLALEFLQTLGYPVNENILLLILAHDQEPDRFEIPCDCQCRSPGCQLREQDEVTLLKMLIDSLRSIRDAGSEALRTEQTSILLKYVGTLLSLEMHTLPADLRPFSRR